MTVDTGLLARLRTSVGARPGEGAVLVWATAYYFLVLCAYYVIRPIRDDIGASSGAEKLAWLFTGTMVGMLLVHPLYTSLVSKLRRRQFISWTYRFFILNLVAFYVLSVTRIAPRFGVGNAVFCVLLGQMLAASVIDHFGLFGAVVRPLSLIRASGIGLMALGVLLIQRA